MQVAAIHNAENKETSPAMSPQIQERDPTRQDGCTVSLQTPWSTSSQAVKQINPRRLMRGQDEQENNEVACK